MSAVTAECDRAIVAAGRLDCSDLHALTAFRAGDIWNGRIGLMRARRRRHDRTPLDVRFSGAGCARSESGTIHFSVTNLEEPWPTAIAVKSRPISAAPN